jgi:hypothetical protein
MTVPMPWINTAHFTEAFKQDEKTTAEMVHYVQDISS